MEKDPRKLNEQAAPENTYPGQRDAAKVEPLAADLLPSVFRTDTNKKIFGAAVEDLFQPSAIENVNFQIGRPSSSASSKQEFLPRADVRRQLECGLLVEDSVGTRVLTADDVAAAQGHANDHLLESQVPVSVLDLPIDADKFLNWGDYYWVEEGMPVLYISGPAEDSLESSFDIERDILGKRYFTLPAQINGRRLELKNGMRLVFQKSALGRKNISGDTSEVHIADGSNQIDFYHEMTQQYYKRLITVKVDGEIKEQGVDYQYTQGSLIWAPESIPAEGSVVEFDMPDYWLTLERDATDPDFLPDFAPHTDRRWQVEGVGTPGGIRLLPRTQQITNTVYSSVLQSQWDRVNIPWDRIRWDAEVPGINSKHYSLLGVAAENRSAHSRVNVWVHKDTIKTVADYLDVDTTTDIVPSDRVALRPILEFDPSLELFNHGLKFRHWVDGVVTKNLLTPEEVIGQDVVYALVTTALGTLPNFQEPNTGIDLFSRIADAIRTKNNDALNQAIRGLEPRIFVINTIAKIKTLLEHLTRGIETKTFDYRFDRSDFQIAPESGKIKINQLPYNSGDVLELSINAVDLNGNQNGPSLEKIYNPDLARCYFRVFNPLDTSRFSVMVITGTPTTFLRTVKAVDLVTSPGSATVLDSLPLDTLLEAVEDQNGWFRVKLKADPTVEGWIQGGAVRDHYIIPCRVRSPSTFSGFSDQRDIKISFVKVEKNSNRIAAVQQRVLWMVDGPDKNKIITFKTNNPYDLVYDSPKVISVIRETAKVNDAVTVSSSGGTLSMREFYWKKDDAGNLVCVPAQTRMSTTDVSHFRVYDRFGVALDEWQTVNGFKPSRLDSTILEFLPGTGDVDPESGYKLSFLPSQFRQLDSDSAAANAIYDIQFKNTLQDSTTYLVNATGTDKTVPGPYNFRRLAAPVTKDVLWSDDLEQDRHIRIEGLSMGYRRAWFRLRSWVSNTYDLSGLTTDTQGRKTLDLPASAWPVYHWALAFRDGKLEVQHTDNFERATDNMLVGGIGERMLVDSSGVTNIKIQDHYTKETLIDLAPNSEGLIVVDISQDFVAGFYDFIVNDGQVTKIMILDVKVDPRAPKVLVNGLPVDYGFELQRDTDKTVLSLALKTNETQGILEVKHQGQFSDASDHATALPGMEYNPVQDVNLGVISPSRLAHSVTKCIRANALMGQPIWTETAKLTHLDGALMADTSSMRGQWASHRLNPNLSEAVASRSMAAWRWHRKFIATLNKFNDQNDLGSETPRYWLDRILQELTVGINYGVPDAVSGMAFTTGSMSSVDYVANGTQTTFEINTAGSEIYRGIYGPDHIYVYVDDAQWLRGQDHKIGGIDYSYQVEHGNIRFSSALPANTKVKIFYASEESVYSGIPASPAKLGLGGVFKPQFVRETWETYDRFLIQRHDGSRIRTFQIHTYSDPDPRDQIVLELEYRIWNGCVNRTGEAGRQRLMLLPPPGTPFSEGRAQAALEWFVNNDVDFRARVDYDIENPWTYNYGGKSWRAIYLETFGTLCPHTHPWEMLGFDDKPVWWNAHYDWIDPTKRAALESALETGLITEPGTPETYDLRVRRRHPLGFPVSNFGELVSPAAWGYEVPPANGAAAPWDLGSLGPQEEVWFRSPAGVWARSLDIIGDPRQVDRYVETGINPFVEKIHTNSPAPVGLLTQAPSSFVQPRPSIGIGAVLFEAYREINLLGESPILELGLVQAVLQFAMGGFSDNSARFRMYHTKYQNSDYVPEEDFSLTINPGIAVSKIRFSAVRVELDGNGYRVYGYDHQYRYFEIATPIKSGPGGNQSASYQRIITTPNGDFVRYLKWNHVPQKIEYGHYFSTKQELFDFFIGLEEIQKSQGLLFDQLNTRGAIDDWQQAALDAMSWIDENWGEDIYVVVSPVSGDQGFRFYHDEGQLDRLDSEQLRRGKILFFTGKIAQNNDLLVTRDIEPNVDYIQPLNKQQIVFADLRLRKYDHVYYFNSFTRFGDLIVDKQANTRMEYLSMVARRSRGWTGRVQAQGLIPQERGLLPGFEALITDITESRRPEKSQFDIFKGNLSKSNVVPTKTSVLNEIILDPSVSFQYRQGLQAATGTNLAIDALFRNRDFDIPGRTQDLSINEQWLFSDGDFGRLGNRKVWEIMIKRDDLTSKRQAVRFSDGPYITKDSRNDTVIDVVGAKDPRWITRNFINPDFLMIARDDIDSNLVASQGWLPSAGVTNLLTADIETRSVDSLLDTPITNEKMLKLLSIRSFSKFVDYKAGDIVWYSAVLYRCKSNVFGGANTAWDPTQWEVYTQEESVNTPPTVWVSDYAQRDSDDQVIDYGWNYLQFLNPLHVEEACPNAINTGLNESKVTFASPHGFRDNDIIFLSGSGDGNYDGLHRVVKVVDNYNLLIAARSTGDVIVYNLVAYRIAATKFRSLNELKISLPTSLNLRTGMLAYVEPDGTPEGEYLVYKFYDGKWGGVNEQADPVLSTVSKFMVDSHSIEKVMLIDPDTEQVLANLEVFDPYKGLIIDEVGQFIDYRSSVDPAVYNIDDLGLPDLDSVDLWGASQIGKIWWDTSRVRYVEYEQSDLKYRIQHWGEQFADSEVQIFEWVRSTTPPSAEDDPDIRLDYSSGVGVPRYSVIEEENPTNNGTTVYYYYWKRGIDVLPTGSTRKYSAMDIENVLQDPDAAGVSWFSPVYGPGSSSNPAEQFNAFVVSNIDSYMSTLGQVVLRVVQRTQPEQQHTNGILVSEGFTGDAIPEYLYRKMKTSIAGRDQYRQNYELKTWKPNTAYAKGDYVIHWAYSEIVKSDENYGARDIPIILELDSNRPTVKEVLRPVLAIYPEPREVRDPLYREKLHRVMIVRGDGYVSSSSFIEDFLSEKIVLSGTSAIIKRGMDISGYRACVILNRRVPDPRLHPLRRYGNAYVPVPQTWYSNIAEARRNMLKAANSYLIKINVVSKPGWDYHLARYRPLFGPLDKDLTPYWYYVDYAAETYQPESEDYLVSNINAIYTDSRDGIFGIIDGLGIVQESYLKSGEDLTLVFQKNGTIQLLEDIWVDAWDAYRWDRYRFDEDNAEVFENIITALREDIFVDERAGYFNLLFFDMVKESLRQIPNADWVAKTTYLDIAQSSGNDLKEVALYFDRRDIQLKEYVNEVKPYHSKIVNINQDLSTNEDLSMIFGERLSISVVRNTEVLSRDYFTDLPVGDTANPDLETQAMFQPVRTGLSTPASASEGPVTWTQSPILSSGQEMLEIGAPEQRVPVVTSYRDPGSFDIDDLT